MKFAMRSARCGVGAVRSPRDIAQASAALQDLRVESGDAFGAVGVGGQRLPDVEQRRCLPVPDSDGVGDRFRIGERKTVTRTALS